MSRIDLNAVLARTDAVIAALTRELKRFRRLRRLVARLLGENPDIKRTKGTRYTIDISEAAGWEGPAPELRQPKPKRRGKVARGLVRDLIHQYMGVRSAGSLDDIVTFIAGECASSADNRHFRATVSKVLNEEAGKGALVAEGRRGAMTWRAAA